MLSVFSNSITLKNNSGSTSKIQRLLRNRTCFALSLTEFQDKLITITLMKNGFLSSLRCKCCPLLAFYKKQKNPSIFMDEGKRGAVANIYNPWRWTPATQFKELPHHFPLYKGPCATNLALRRSIGPLVFFSDSVYAVNLLPCCQIRQQFTFLSTHTDFHLFMRNSHSPTYSLSEPTVPCPARHLREKPPLLIRLPGASRSISRHTHTHTLIDAVK